MKYNSYTVNFQSVLYCRNSAQLLRQVTWFCGATWESESLTEVQHRQQPGGVMKHSYGYPSAQCPQLQHKNGSDDVERPRARPSARAVTIETIMY